MLAFQERSFARLYANLKAAMLHAPRVATERWQGVDVRNNPAAVSYELRHVCMEVNLRGVEDLDHWRRDVAPNLPWADDHFEERVSGSPLNPGKEWANWPWASSADRFRDEGALFNHTYAERLWPRWPRRSPGGVFERRDGLRGVPDLDTDRQSGMTGIAYRYGDLQDLVELLAREPHTRQAWIPLFFPEDTGVADGGRKPCTLGYQFLVRDDLLHVWYPLRSCDLVRHWRDDVYLAIRLALWVIDRCREIEPTFWRNVKPGTYGMQCTSLHVFANDRIALEREDREQRSSSRRAEIERPLSAGTLP